VTQKKRRKKTKGRTKISRRNLAAAPVTAAQLRALQRELARRAKTPSPSVRDRGRTASAGARRHAAPQRWNPEPDDVQRSVAHLVLTIVEFLRLLMERQAIRRMEQRTLTDKEIESVGLALMRLEETVRDIGKRFGLTPEDLNLDLGPITLV
jgi:gas vesicle protein GvpK